jgi:transcriptional regulator with XRE-family HTH domain
MSKSAVKQHVGAALKRAREARGISVSDLSRRSGVAKATLSAMESGRANPTLETLWSLSAALHVSLGELLDPPEPQVSVVRANEGTLVRGESVVARLMQSFEMGTARIEIFSAEVKQRIQISPAHARGVAEHVIVTSGRLRIGPVDEPVELETGDYLRMSPAWPHVYQALEARTKMVLVMEFPRE